MSRKPPNQELFTLIPLMALALAAQISIWFRIAIKVLTNVSLVMIMISLIWMEMMTMMLKLI